MELEEVKKTLEKLVKDWHKSTNDYFLIERQIQFYSQRYVELTGQHYYWSKAIKPE